MITTTTPEPAANLAPAAVLAEELRAAGAIVTSNVRIGSVRAEVGTLIGDFFFDPARLGGRFLWAVVVAQGADPGVVEAHTRSITAAQAALGLSPAASTKAAIEATMTESLTDAFKPGDRPSIAELHRKWRGQGLPAHTWAAWLRLYHEMSGEQPRQVDHAHNPGLNCYPRCPRWGS